MCHVNCYRNSAGKPPRTAFKWLLFILMACSLAMEKGASKNDVGAKYRNTRQYGML